MSHYGVISTSSLPHKFLLTTAFLAAMNNSSEKSSASQDRRDAF
jgi:hypothetical protein